LINKNITIILIVVSILITSGIGVAHALHDTIEEAEIIIEDTMHEGTLIVGEIDGSRKNTASGVNSAAFGTDTTSSNNDSVSFGYGTTASGFGSAAFGYQTTAQPLESFVIGRYNEISGDSNNWIYTDPLFVIGNGASSTHHNALTVLKSGNVGISVSNPTYKLQVAGIIKSTTGGFGFPDGTTQTTASISTSNLLKFEGADSDVVNGPHIKITTSADSYPVMQQLNWSHNNIALNFDSYYDGKWRSSDLGSNYQIYKFGDKLSINYDKRTSAGHELTWNPGIVLDYYGNVGIGTAYANSQLEVTGYFELATSSGKPPAVDCNSMDKIGRMKVDSSNNNLYLCTNNGWQTK